MEKTHLRVSIKCMLCNHKNPHYILLENVRQCKNSILKTFWCDHCREAQVIRYLLNRDETDIIITQRLEPSTVFVPPNPEIGLTIKPRGKGGKRRNIDEE